MKIHAYLIVALMLLGSDLTAQTVVVRKKDNNTSSTTRTRPSTPSSSYGQYSTYVHALKFNLLGTLAGDYAAIYERKLNKKNTVELGVGLTYGNLIEYNLFNHSIEPDGMLLNKLGYSARFGYKYFPNGGALYEAPYIGLDMGIRHYNRRFETYYNGIDNSVNEYYSWIDGAIIFGYQSKVGQRLLSDIYIGSGIRRVNKFYGEYVWGFDPNQGVNDYFMQTNTINTWTPMVVAGLKVGMIFR